MIDEKHEKTVGVDEVGRGALAGPLAIGAFVVLKEEGFELLKNIKDSKKLSHKKREEWASRLHLGKEAGLFDFSVSFTENTLIDETGLVSCLRMGVEKALSYINCRSEFRIILDAGLKAPETYINQKSFVKGDELFPVISAASIVAKVERDSYMTKIATKYPQYFFDKNAGYGTKEHIKAIKTEGPSKIHRMSFLGTIC